MDSRAGDGSHLLALSFSPQPGFRGHYYVSNSNFNLKFNLPPWGGGGGGGGGGSGRKNLFGSPRPSKHTPLSDQFVEGIVGPKFQGSDRTRSGRAPGFPEGISNPRLPRLQLIAPRPVGFIS